MNKDGRINAFTDLKVWQEGHSLVIDIYRITKDFPKEELYSLTNQMRRSAMSVTANIAEGFGRQGYKEKIQFYYLAHGSLTELKDQFLIARDIDYLADSEFVELDQKLVSVHRLLLGLIKKSKEILNSKI